MVRGGQRPLRPQESQQKSSQNGKSLVLNHGFPGISGFFFESFTALSSLTVDCLPPWKSPAVKRTWQSAVYHSSAATDPVFVCLLSPHTHAETWRSAAGHNHSRTCNLTAVWLGVGGFPAIACRTRRNQGMFMKLCDWWREQKPKRVQHECVSSSV